MTAGRSRLGIVPDVSTIERVKAAVRWYGDRQGSMLAAAVTYFAFLSFFPLLALGFAAVGLVARFVPEADDALGSIVSGLLPGMIGNGRGQLSLDDLRTFAGPVAGVGLVAVLYSGLGWISEMRGALTSMFDVSQPSAGRFVGRVTQFVRGIGRDLAALALLGGVLVFSVTVSSAVVGVFDGWLAGIASVGIGVLANTALFYALFRLLPDPDLPRSALLSGALLGAVAFEALKQLSRALLASTVHQPAFQAFGIALVLLVWIYYFSRVVMFAAAWAATTSDLTRPG